MTRRLLLIAVTATLCCGNPTEGFPEGTDPGGSPEVPEADLPAAETGELATEVPPATDARDPWPDLVIAELRPVTTLVEVVRPVEKAAKGVDGQGVPLVPESRLGQVEPGPGEPFIARTDLATRTDAGARRSLLWFVLLSDSHIVDEASPGHVPRTDPKFPSAFRNPEAFTSQALDALVRTLLGVMGDRKYDFALHTGDGTENGQENELAWFLGVLGGGPVHPASGSAMDTATVRASVIKL